MPFGWVLAATPLLFLVGCGGTPGVPDPPEPVAPPGIRIEPARLDPLVAAYLAPPKGEPVVDELLASPVLRDADFQAALVEWIDYWQNAATPWFPDFLRRMGSFEQTIDSALAERRMPASLRYLPLIESGYNPAARSRASAVGLWQFLEGTAGELGMQVTAFVDERRSPFKSTEAALEFLSYLHDDFGSWFLALAAYNGGPNRVRRILGRYAPVAQPSDSLFWALREYWPPETRDFLPKLLGAITVAQNPARYGYPPVEPDAPFHFDEVTVSQATTFDVLARAAEVGEDEIRRLNPELYRGFTPPGQTFAVRVPSGRAEAFEANYARIPDEERMTLVEHRVAPGETLSHIALRYGISVADLRAANPDVRPRYLRIGARLTVPIMLARGGSG